MRQDLTVPRKPDGIISTKAWVLKAIYEQPTARYVDLAAALDMKETTIRRAIAALRKDGFISSVLDGRRNRYTVHLEQPIAAGSEIVLADFLAFLSADRQHS